MAAEITLTSRQMQQHYEIAFFENDAATMERLAREIQRMIRSGSVYNSNSRSFAATPANSVR